MSRRPVHLVVAEANGKPYGRRAVWLAIRELREFTAAHLHAHAGVVSRALVAGYLLSLCKAGYLEKVRRAGNRHIFRLVRDTGVDAPRLRRNGTEVPATGQQNMWVAMRIVGGFTPREIMEAASTKASPISLTSAELYLRSLHAVGYLCAATGDEEAYRLVRDTGGLAPMIQRTRCVFDPNLNRIVGHEVVEP